MGSVLSSNTVYAVAYLTDLGRKYLFDPITNHRFVTDNNGNTIDAFKIVYFSMSDPDYNYNLTQGIALESGEIANVSGKNSDCIKGSIVSDECNLISVNGQVGGVIGINPTDNVLIDVPYILETNIANNVLVVNTSTFQIATGI